MSKNGSIVITLLLILVLTMLAAGILLRSVIENKAAKRMSTAAEAFWVAETGIQNMIWEIRNNQCAGFVQQGTNTACSTCTSCGGGNKTLAVSVAGSCDYDVVLNNANTAATSTGSCPNRSASNLIQRVVQATVGAQSPFAYAAFAQTQVTLSNNTFVDSYNSNNGAYSNANSSTNGDVGTNGTASGTIIINNNATVGGDVSTGVNGTVNLGNNALVTGTTSHTNNVPLPNVVVPSALTGLSSGGTLTIPNNGSQTLTAGDYKYSAINMSNNTTLNVSGGAVRVYLTSATAVTASNNTTISVASGATLQLFIDGVLSVSNNMTISSSGNVPKNVQIYSTYTGNNGMNINNNGVLAAAIYAPGTDILIGNNDDVLGSVVGKTVTVSNNAAIHYDETLQTLSTPAGASGITTWQEI